MDYIENLKHEINQKTSNHDISGALDIITNNLENDPRNIELMHLRADINYKAGNFPTAIDDLSKILEINPEDEIAIQKINLIKDILLMMKIDIFESTNLYEPPNSMFSDGTISFR